MHLISKNTYWLNCKNALSPRLILVALFKCLRLIFINMSTSITYILLCLMIGRLEEILLALYPLYVKFELNLSLCFQNLLILFIYYH